MFCVNLFISTVEAFSSRFGQSAVIVAMFSSPRLLRLHFLRHHQFLGLTSLHVTLMQLHKVSVVVLVFTSLLWLISNFFCTELGITDVSI